MQLVQADDAEAFDALYDRLAPRALRVAASLCGDRDRVLEAAGWLPVPLAGSRELPP